MLEDSRFKTLYCDYPSITILKQYVVVKTNGNVNIQIQHNIIDAAQQTPTSESANQNK